MFKLNQEQFSDAFSEYGRINTYHVSGKTPTAVRAREVMDFSNADRALITNARCMVEGVDIPNVDCVLFADPRNSIVDIVQAVGRALRPAEGKEYGYVVVPVLLKGGDGEDVSLPLNAYAAILMVLRALAANDERIIEYFRTHSRGERRQGSDNVFEVKLSESFHINLFDFIQSVEIQVWSRMARLAWKPFEEARAFARSLALRNQEDWISYCKGYLSRMYKKPVDIPATPNEVYKYDGWKSWVDWLWIEGLAPSDYAWRPYEEARAFVHSLGLRGINDWRLYCTDKLPDKGSKPADIHADPYKVYKDKGWKNWGDWLGLGAGTIEPRRQLYRSFEEARSFVRSLGLSGQTEWTLYCKGQLPGRDKKPDDIHSNPYNAYNNICWKSWDDWLGAETIAPQNRVFRLFEEARAFARSLVLPSEKEWHLYCKGALPGKGKKSDDIPSAPWLTYKDDGWKSWGDWLGTRSVKKK